jgi:hypothetical protein
LRERRALIQKRVPFIVPGNQLYLPVLGLDLREELPRGRVQEKATTLTPSTQALLIHCLLATPWSQVVSPAKVARELNYTVMTASRAANQLAASGIAAVSHKPERGNPLHLVFKATTPRDVWRDAESVASSPVTRRVWIDQLPDGLNCRVAGVDALARHTMLAAPAHRVYAVKRDDWLSACVGDPTLEDLGRDEHRIELEIWSYSPSLVQGDEVDPLSLIASLREEPDERVQLALNELRDTMTW